MENLNYDKELLDKVANIIKDKWTYDSDKKKNYKDIVQASGITMGVFLLIKRLMFKQLEADCIIKYRQDYIDYIKSKKVNGKYVFKGIGENVQCSTFYRFMNDLKKI